MTVASTRPVHVYLGSYTTGRSEGLYVCDLAVETGRLSNLRLAARLEFPTFLALDPTGRFLYAVANSKKSGGPPEGIVVAYAIHHQTGILTLLNQQPSLGRGPCHVTVTSNGRFLLAANYDSGSLGVLPVRADGGLDATCEFVPHHGASVNPQRQTGPHVHSVNQDPSGNWVLAADLGTDHVMVYRFEPASGKLLLAEHGQVAVRPGSGPRHLAFDSAGRHVYLVTELSNELITYAFDPQNGTLQEEQCQSILPSGFTGTSYGADVQVHPSGQFVYASNRGHDSIAVFIRSDDGRVTPAGHVPSQGHFPRGFAMTSDGSLFLVANQESDRLVSFRVDKNTGNLVPTGQILSAPEATCLKLGAFH